uniref:Metallothionein n=1 Tax=Panthera leo TaxID=9689 RepID=A0A8C8XN75_PANLE
MIIFNLSTQWDTKYDPCICKWFLGAPGWLSQLSIRLRSGHDLTGREFRPHVKLCADSSECTCASCKKSGSCCPTGWAKCARGCICKEGMRQVQLPCPKSRRACCQSK